jgi:hypothetical protein
MDETTKVIIATISGFVIAFFAEPVKTWFQDRAKVNELRLALYNEILMNYEFLDNILNKIPSKDEISNLPTFTVNYFVQIDCYKYAISQEIKTFYRLRESAYVSGVYKDLVALIDISEKNQNGVIGSTMQSLVGGYIDVVEGGIRSGNLDKEIASKFLGKKELKEILSKSAQTKKP